MDKFKIVDAQLAGTIADIDENSSSDVVSLMNDLCHKVDENELSYSESESPLNNFMKEINHDLCEKMDIEEVLKKKIDHNSFEEMKLKEMLKKSDVIENMDNDLVEEMKVEEALTKENAIKEISKHSCEEMEVGVLIKEDVIKEIGNHSCEEALIKKNAIKEIDNDSCEEVLIKNDHFTGNQLSTNEKNESLLSIDDEPGINITEKENDSPVVDSNIHTEKELNPVEELDITTDNESNVDVKTKMHDSAIHESLTDKDKFTAHSVTNDDETDSMEVEKPDDIEKDQLPLDSIVLKNNFGSRKRPHSDDDEEEEEIMSAAKKCFQALCESSEVMEDNDLSLSPKPALSDSNNLSKFSLISPKTSVTIPVSTENSSDSLSQSNVDLSQEETPLKQELFPATNNSDSKKIVTPEIEDGCSSSVESELKESYMDSKSENLSLKRSSPSPHVDQSNPQIYSEDDDIEILSPKKLDKSNCEDLVATEICNNEVGNHDVGSVDSKLIEKRSEDNSIQSDVSEKVGDENFEVSKKQSNNAEISVVWEGNDDCEKKQVIKNDNGHKAENIATNDVKNCVIEPSDKDSCVKIDSEIDKCHMISNDCIVKEISENSDENCIMDVISDKDTRNSTEKISKNHDDCEIMVINHDVCKNDQIDSEKLCNGKDTNEDLKHLDVKDVLGTASGSHNSDSNVATVKTDIKDENEIPASTSGHSPHVKSEILLKKDEIDNSSVEINHCMDEILDNCNISTNDLVIDFEAGTFTIPFKAFFSLFDTPKVERENFDTNLITQAEAAELRALLEEERERGKQVRVALRAVYSQQRALYRACGHVPKVDTRTVGVMTRISDDSDTSQDNACDVQVPTSSTASVSVAANSLADAKPKNTFTINNNSEINCTPLASTTSSILNKALNNISISPVASNSESFKKPTLVIQQSQMSGNKHVGSSQVTLSKEKSILKNQSETISKSNENTTPQIIDLTDDDDPIPTPSLQPKKEIAQSKESPRQTVNSNNPKPVYLPSSVQIIPSQTGNNIPGSNNVQIIRSATSPSTRLTYFVSQQPSALFPVRPPFNSQSPGGLSNNMVIFRPVGVNIQNSQGGMQKPVQQYGIRTGQQNVQRPMVRPALVQQPAASKNFGSGQITLTPRFAQHPAPLPQPPTYPANKNLKALPPKPSLKMNRTSSGISLSWNMTIHNAHADISAYQLYAYQEGTGRVDSSLWKKVSDIKAMPLPMACTLTQFVEGHKYHFAMRAIDVHRRVGPFSDPITVHHRPSKGVNK